MGHVGTSIVFTRSGLLAVSVTVASGLLGFCDDYLAIRNARNLGLNKLAKFIGLLLIAAVFAIFAVYWVHTSTNLSFTRFSLPGWNLTAVGWILLAVLVIVGASNAVNLTDGLDGLATGSSVTIRSIASTRRSISALWRWGSSGRAWAFFGGTRHRPKSSWVIPAPWR
jgi:phospho-N-acetylmuramoyl-pentapeptide-transferase